MADLRQIVRVGRMATQKAKPKAIRPPEGGRYKS
jgi:3-deoxy-D-arabino-heptulosonate 7-phosphate (DAHP) synthase class II